MEDPGMTRRLAAFATATVLAALAPAQNPYGYGTPGPGPFEPELVCGQPWMGNASFGCTIQNGLGGAGGLFVFSAQPASFYFGTTLVLVDPNPLNVLLFAPVPLGGGTGVPGAGFATLALPLTFAPTPALAGINVFAQGFVDDPSNPGLYAATRGVRLELGYPPLVFVGTSVGGSVDNHYFVDPIAQNVAHSGGNGFTDNVSGAVFAHGGRDLFVSTSIAHQVSRADLSGPAPVWSTLYASGNVFYGIGHDWTHDRVYSLTGPTASTREIVAIDSNSSSATYGQVVGTTVGVGGGATLERWGLSRNGKLAAVPAVFGSGGSLIIVDTDAASATYLQSVITSVVPGSFGFAFSVAAGFTPNDEYAIVLISGLGVQAIARFHLPTQTWVDHDAITPGVQHIDLGPSYTVPSAMQVSRDGKFAVVSGLGAGSVGWAVRVDMDPAAVPAYTVTPYLAGQGLLAGAYGASISPDGTQAAFTSTTPAKLLIVDATTGALQANVPLPGASNIYTAEWR
jgi:hypothetical protein